MAKFFTLLGAVIVAGYLYMGREHWFSEWEHQAAVGRHPLFSTVVDVSTTNTFRWRLPKEDWFYEEGEARVSLVNEPGDGIPKDRTHNNMVTAARFSADGRRIVTASLDREAHVVDAVSGRRLAVLRGHAGPVLDAAFSADGRSVVTGGRDGCIRVWPLDPMDEALRRKPRDMRPEELARYLTLESPRPLVR